MPESSDWLMAFARLSRIHHGSRLPDGTDRWFVDSLLAARSRNSSLCVACFGWPPVCKVFKELILPRARRGHPFNALSRDVEVVSTFCACVVHFPPDLYLIGRSFERYRQRHC